MLANSYAFTIFLLFIFNNVGLDLDLDCQIMWLRKMVDSCLFGQKVGENVRVRIMEC